jgi:hypothetical protein
MTSMQAVAAILRAEFFLEVKRFLDRRGERYRDDDSRWRVRQDALMDLKIKFPGLSLESLEMLAAVFGGSAASAATWMNTPNPALENQRPAEMAATAEGARAVQFQIERFFRRLN